MSAYNITHCIYCGKQGFKNVDEVIKHVKEKHMTVGGGTQQPSYVEITSVEISQKGNSKKAYTRTITTVQHVQNGCQRPWLFGRTDVHVVMEL